MFTWGGVLRLYFKDMEGFQNHDTMGIQSYSLSKTDNWVGISLLNEISLSFHLYHISYLTNLGRTSSPMFAPWPRQTLWARFSSIRSRAFYRRSQIYFQLWSLPTNSFITPMHSFLWQDSPLNPKARICAYSGSNKEYSRQASTCLRTSLCQRQGFWLSPVM